MTAKFSNYYASQIKKGLDQKQKLECNEVNLNTSRTKQYQAGWLASVLDDLGENDDLM